MRDIFPQIRLLSSCTDFYVIIAPFYFLYYSPHNIYDIMCSDT
jgi:hypothetical protein